MHFGSSAFRYSNWGLGSDAGRTCVLCGVDVGQTLGLVQAEPAIVSGLIRAGALQNATTALSDVAQTYSAAVRIGICILYVTFK
ncbi:hypothetical protein P8452_59560 [Trifolium repens]|nr:hypothetical protein P8452_59560 [Trifolium repens]